MKKLLMLILGCLMFLTLFGCSKGNSNSGDVSSAALVTNEINSPIIGTWKYYKDVPSMPSCSTFKLIFNKDGTYSTSSDKIENSEKTHADTWGSGTYTISQDNTVLTLNLNTGKTKIKQIEIKKDNEIEQLEILEDDRSKVSVTVVSTAVSADGESETYYTIFKKQE